jgi:hypothetical protein
VFAFYHGLGYTDNMMMKGSDMYTFVIGVYEAGVFRVDYTNRLIRYETIRALTPKDALNLVKDMYEDMFSVPSGSISYSILRSDYKEIA